MQCKYCGKEMKIGFSKRKMFCSQKCTNDYHNQIRSKGVIKKETHCRICGKELVGAKRVYCSEECSHKGALEYHRKRNLEEYKKYRPEELPKPKKKRGRPKKGLSLEQAAKLAKAEGISWGEYYQKHRLWEKECWN